MSWFFAHPWMTFILAYCAIFAARDAIIERAKSRALSAKVMSSVFHPDEEAMRADERAGRRVRPDLAPDPRTNARE